MLPAYPYRRRVLTINKVLNIVTCRSYPILIVPWVPRSSVARLALALELKVIIVLLRMVLVLQISINWCDWYWAMYSFTFPADEKKPDTFVSGFLNGCLAVTYFHMAAATLSSARLRFTTEFGMGSGGSTALWPPGINCHLESDRQGGRKCRKCRSNFSA